MLIIPILIVKNKFAYCLKEGKNKYQMIMARVATGKSKRVSEK